MTSAIALRGACKSFGGVQALRDVDLEIGGREIHGLLGENGSGKSTLIKILAGYHSPEPGATLEVDGASVALPLAAGEFRRLGLAFVHQDLALHEELTVLENLHVGTFARSRGLRVPWGDLRRRSREAFARYGIEHIDVRATVASLGETDRALLAIVRAAEDIRTETAGTGRSGLLVLDEPTVFLPREGVDRLFELVREVVTHGASVLFVSHDLDEVLQITDRITVLRDGRNVGTVVTRTVSHDDLVELIIGRRLVELAQSRATGPLDSADVAVGVHALSGGLVHQLSFELRPGEVLGFTGLLGSGFEQIPYLLFGARPAHTGTMTFGGHTFDLRRLQPHVALGSGVALIPADRRADGAVGDLTVGENVTLQVLDDHSGALGLRTRALRDTASDLLDRFDVRPDNPDLPYHALSGGNQQKALLAKWLHTAPGLLLLHEPTQGVDIGARQQIMELLRAAAADGLPIIIASTDHEQLALVCDRVIVLSRGEAVHELRGAEVTKDRLVQLTLGTAPTEVEVTA